ncbi:putative gustatory receptor 28b isoform X1 [Galleria mellonella]|uniref:Gustatory receptor n=1 Tax=Galleria mellonella TaxID=7137 RepID=A0A6J3C0V5_GALME|nr:putative gustatory receptor 28b isoform X1 [Galleria mellonella]
MSFGLRNYFPFIRSDKVTFHNIFQPIYLMLSLLGLFPYSVKYNSKSYKIIYRSLYLNVLYVILLISIISVFVVLHVQFILSYTDISPFTSTEMTYSNYVLELLLLFCACITAYLCAFKNKYKYVDILNKLTTFWFELPRNGYSIMRQLNFHVSVSITVLFLLLMSLFFLNFTRSEGSWKQILVVFSFIIPQIAQFVHIVFYCMLIFMVGALLSNIEDNCRDVANEKNHFTYSSVKNTSSSLTLKDIELVYVKVIQVKRDINEAFQPSILLTLLQCFHAMVGESYTLYYGIISPRSLTLHELFNTVVWISYQLTKVFAFAYTGNVLKVKVLKIGQTLHKIPTDRQDIRLNMEIQHFLSLIAHQGPEVTVYGFFFLDATLFFNVLASATMYLIVLVQLTGSDD